MKEANGLFSSFTKRLRTSRESICKIAFSFY